jgi:hypothetical protein
MLALVAAQSRELIMLRDAMRASWTGAERKLRAQVANSRQLELIALLRLPNYKGQSDGRRPAQ